MAFGRLLSRPVLIVVNTDHAVNTSEWNTGIYHFMLGAYVEEQFRNSFFVDPLKLPHGNAYFRTKAL